MGGQKSQMAKPQQVELNQSHPLVTPGQPPLEKFEQKMSKTIDVQNQLGLIFQSYCLYCYQRFNCKDRQPMLCSPCQHSFCQPCLKTAIFNKKQQGFCSECNMQLTQKDVCKNNIMYFMLQTIHKYIGLRVDTAEESEAVKNELVDKIYENYPEYYTCRDCNLNFNRFKRQPVVICKNGHIICSSCLEVSQKKCSECMSEYLPNLVPSRLVLRLSEFVYDFKFSHKIKVVVNSQQELTIDTNPDVNIKDIFDTLRDYGHISRILRPEDCVFYTSGGQVAKGEQHNTEKVRANKEEKIGKNDIIYIQYSDQTLKQGAKATVPSQICKNLPIKINSFEPLNHLKHSSNIYLKIEQQVEKQIMKQSILLVQTQPRKDYQQDLNFMPQTLQCSIPEQKLVKFSQKVYELEKKQNDQRLQARQKSFPFRMQLPKGSKVSEDFLEKVNSSLSPQKRKSMYRNFIEKSEFRIQHEKQLCFEIQRVINKQPNKQQLELSKMIQADLDKKALQGDGASIVLKALQAQLKDGQTRVIFTPTKNDATEITMKSIVSNYFTNRIKIKQKFQQDNNWQFQKIHQSYQQFNKFCNFLKKKYHYRYGLSQQSIVIHSITKGSLETVVSTNQPQAVINSVRNLDRSVELLPFFQQLQISPDYLDPKGNIKFKDSKSKVQFRGNWPYYQPVKCRRYGFKVSKLFDNGNDEWLMMKNLPGEWPVGFHGIGSVNTTFNQVKNVVNSILSGFSRIEKNCFKVGKRQKFQKHFCINPPFQRELVGQGVYLTPHFYTALGYAKQVSVQNEMYHIVLQCRINPRKIKIPKQIKQNKKQYQDYWVLNQSQDIRPYGIILIKNQDKKAYPKTQDQFNQIFSYQRYSSRIQQSFNPRPVQP